jgi:hypothetical protein
MTDHLPSVRQIDRARPSLRQAFEIAAMIEGMRGYAPEIPVDRHRQQLVFQLEQAASALGLELRGSAPSQEMAALYEAARRAEIVITRHIRTGPNGDLHEMSAEEISALVDADPTIQLLRKALGARPVSLVIDNSNQAGPR